MDVMNNPGLIVVNLDGCVTSSGGQGEVTQLRTDCVYTVSMMASGQRAPDGMFEQGVNATPCLQQSLDNSVAVQAEQSNEMQNQTQLAVSNGEKDNGYYDLILNYIKDQSFPDNVDDSRRKLISKRSRHYSVIGEQLYYGQKFPKKVVSDVEAKKKLMKSLHVIEGTGVHVGVHKMYSQLKKEYFWCGMYMDVSKYVKYCEDCVDADLPLAFVKTLAKKQKLRRKKKSPIGSKRTKFRQILSKANIGTWKQVELRLNGPYPGNCYVLTISDPACCWVEAKVVKRPDLGTKAANFLLSIFMQLGFAHVSLVGFKANVIKKLKCDYKSQLKKIISKSAIKDCSLGGITDFQNDIPLCPWISELLPSLMNEFPDTWEEEMPQFLFRFRSTPSKKYSESPFTMMFGRPAVFVSQEENKENVSRRRSKRLQGNTPMCKKGRSSVESTIATKSLKQGRERLARAAKSQHNGKMLSSEDEDDPSSFNDNEEPSEILDVSPSEMLPVAPKETEVVEVDDVRANTVAAVQAYLTATRKERSRRGQYKRYTPEQQDEIASYALQYGSLAAVKHFSEKFNDHISESTIRNFAKHYKSFSVEIQEQIGEYFYHHGLEETSQHFRSLGYDVTPNLLRKFRKKYMTKHIPEKSSVDKSSLNAEKDIYGDDLKLEIGEYAVQFGIADAIDHFNKKLNINLKEINVTKCRKFYQENKEATTDNPDSSTNLSDQETMQTDSTSTESETIQTESMEVVQTSFSTLNTGPQTIVYNQPYQPLISPIFHQNPATVDQTTVAAYQQSIPQVLAHNPQLVFSQTPFQTHSAYTPNYNQLQPSKIQLPNSSDTNQLVAVSDNTNLNINSHCNNTSMIISQHPILITQTQGTNNVTVQLDQLTMPTFQNQLSHQHELASNTINFLQPSTLNYSSTNTGNVAQHLNNTNTFSTVDTIDNNVSQMISVIQVGPNIVASESSSNNEVSEAVEVQLPNSVPNNSAPIVKPQNPVNKNIKSEKRVRERTNYVTYSPEIRAEIGRYAAEYGNIRAITHFENIVGKKLPESTVRGLKEKYMAKMQLCSRSSGSNKTVPIKSLGFAPRGRPTRLGKYDDVVRRCIQDLVSNGERVTSFLAITTAKQVLLEHEPQLLAENGGVIKLTTNWAKSFLKRIGIHNNS